MAFYPDRAIACITYEVATKFGTVSISVDRNNQTTCLSTNTTACEKNKLGLHLSVVTIQLSQQVTCKPSIM